MNNSLTVPIAIVLAGALIAGALYFAGRAASPSLNNSESPDPSASAENVPPVTAEDHILGNPDAPIVIIEYSDIECPFCKQFHITMKEIIEEYGPTGQVAWVYRHFPLSQIHPNAPRLAEASECVASVGGKEAFWPFLDEIFRIAPGNARFPMDRLAEAVSAVGVDSGAVKSCLDAGTFRGLIEQQFNDAIASGGQGTPHNILLFGGEVLAIPGAQSYMNMKNTIEQIISAGAQN